MDKILDQIVDYWPVSIIVIELFVIMLFAVLLKADNYWKRHRLFYELECKRELISQLESQIETLNLQAHEGNIKFLESKKEWLQSERDLRFKYQASVLITENEIKKVEKQIEKLKSK